MDRFDDAKVGDKVYDRVYGFGVVHQSVGDTTIKIVFGDSAFYETFVVDGRRYRTAAEPTLFYVDNDNKYSEKRPIPKVPWDKVPVNTKILVGTAKRYLASDKKYFGGGTTSWSSSEVCYPLPDHAVLAEEITIDGVVYPIGSK